MCSNARFLVSGFHCECLLPNKEEKLEEAWELVFSFGHFDSSLFGKSPNARSVKIVLRSVKSQGKVREFFGF